MKSKKQNHTYFVSRKKLLTSGGIELNPGPVTQGNISKNTIKISINSTWLENSKCW